MCISCHKHKSKKQNQKKQKAKKKKYRPQNQQETNKQTIKNHRGISRVLFVMHAGKMSVKATPMFCSLLPNCGRSTVRLRKLLTPSELNFE